LSSSSSSSSSCQRVHFTDEKEKVASFWKKQGQSIDHDNYFMPLEQLALADFNVFVCKQREGDFVIIPPEGAHQVVHTVQILLFLSEVMWRGATERERGRRKEKDLNKRGFVLYHREDAVWQLLGIVSLH
jgi:hypothetical protein